MDNYLYEINSSNENYPIINADYFTDNYNLTDSANTVDMCLSNPNKISSHKQLPFVGEWYPTYSLSVKLNKTIDYPKQTNTISVYLSKMFTEQVCILFITRTRVSTSYYILNGKVSDQDNEKCLIINGVGNNSVTGRYQYFNIKLFIPNSINIDQYYPMNTFKQAIETCVSLKMVLSISNTNIVKNSLTPKDLFDYLVEDVMEHVSKRIIYERERVPNVELWCSLLDIIDDGKYIGIKCKLRNTGGMIIPADEIVITLQVFHVPIFTTEYGESHENYISGNMTHYPVILKNSYQLGMKEMDSLASGLLTKNIKFKNVFKNVPVKILISISTRCWTGSDYLEPVIRNYDVEYPEYTRGKYIILLTSMPGVKTTVKLLTHNIFALAFFPERKRKIPFIGNMSIKDNFDHINEDYNKINETTEVLLFFLPIRFVRNRSVHRKNIHISYKIGYHPFSPVPYEHFACIPIDPNVGGRCIQEIDLQHYYKGFSGSSKKMNRIECESCNSIKQPESCDKCMICNPPKCKICKEPVKMNRINLNTVIIRMENDNIFCLHKKCADGSVNTETHHVDYSIPQTQDFQAYYNLKKIESNTVISNKFQCNS